MDDPLVGKLLWPLARLLAGLTCGLLIAALLESFRWTTLLGKITSPISRMAHLGPQAAAAFALAFISPTSANAFLSAKYSEGAISSRELMLANLFNSLPAFLTHMPTIFFLLWPVLGMAALTYVGLAFFAAFARTLFVLLLGAVLLPFPKLEICGQADAPAGRGIQDAFRKAWPRFCKRLPSLVLYTTPVYIAMYYGQELGFFKALELWLSSHLDWLTFLRPQAMGIIGLQLMAELGATLGAAGAALQDSSLTPYEIVIAMLVGNIISTPVRAIRHQLPVYSGLFSPGLAARLILANQSLRAASMVLVLAAYIILFR